ncbi:MAG: outer membrane beta-barrel protein [Draconibacterium sp.]|nr:outer membrane beta-barrel protein [Draconibacterium sp.]
MKNFRKIILLSLLIMFSATVKAQVLISLLLGDALNTDKIEFGLEGGMSRSYINSISSSEPINNFDLGFYFHILMKNNSYLSTGVKVKSNVGATGMDVYSMDDADFDAVYAGGTLTKKIPGFYVPILFQQRIKQKWYVEAGPQLGLLYREVDIFETEKLGGDLEFKLDVKDQYKHIDAGLTAGLGYKFGKAKKSTSIGVNYYYGLVDVSLNPDYKIKNSALYFFVKIPIGAAPKEPKE